MSRSSGLLLLVHPEQSVLTRALPTAAAKPEHAASSCSGVPVTTDLLRPSQLLGVSLHKGSPALVLFRSLCCCRASQGHCWKRPHVLLCCSCWLPSSLHPVCVLLEPKMALHSGLGLAVLGNDPFEALFWHRCVFSHTLTLLVVSYTPRGGGCDCYSTAPEWKRQLQPYRGRKPLTHKEAELPPAVPCVAHRSPRPYQPKQVVDHGAERDV